MKFCCAEREVEGEKDKYVGFLEWVLRIQEQIHMHSSFDDDGDDVNVKT